METVIHSQKMPNWEVISVIINHNNVKKKANLKKMSTL